MVQVHLMVQSADDIDADAVVALPASAHAVDLLLIEDFALPVSVMKFPASQS